jgi:hypothetical protein
MEQRRLGWGGVGSLVLEAVADRAALGYALSR